MNKFGAAGAETLPLPEFGDVAILRHPSPYCTPKIQKIVVGKRKKEEERKKENRKKKITKNKYKKKVRGNGTCMALTDPSSWTCSQ